jgi:YebC/PmpR family DNA-binding regulatory protein
MAGHSKWANIQHRKGNQDAKRGKLFTKVIREITVAARTGGADIGSNPRLRAAIDKALSNNMTRDTIDRAIKRGVGGLEGTEVEDIRYEGYGPGGIAVMVECMTDNRTRTVAEVRHAFNKCGGNLGTDGSVNYLFAKTGVLLFAPGTDTERLLEAALDAGADDVLTQDDQSSEVLCTPEQFYPLRDQLTKAGLAADSAEVTQRPATLVPVQGDEAERVAKLLLMLDDLDDVQNVYSNAELPDEIVARLG